jgi:hypothetical protein
MRRLSTTLFIVVALVLTFGITVVASGCGTSAQMAGLSPDDLSPEGILAKAVAASQDMTSAKGSFEVGLSFDVDSSRLSEEEKALVGQPMKVSGTLAYGSGPQAAEFAADLSMAGQATNIGMKLLGNKVWVRFMDQWYETPPEMQQMLNAPAGQEAKAGEIQQLLSDLGIDPITWMKDLRLVGEETLDDTDTYHLAATPDLTKMIADMAELMQSGELMKLLEPSGSTEGLMGSSSALLTPDEVQQMEKQLETMFQDLAADLWIAKDSFMLLKFTAGALMTPPPGEDAAGVNAIRLDAKISLQDINDAVTVEPPASAQPWTALQKAIEANPGMFPGLFSGAVSGGEIAAPKTSQ